MTEKLVGKNTQDTVLGGVITIDMNNDWVGINTTVRIEDTTLQIGGQKAILLSRLTTAQRDALTGTSGMLIYNATTNKLNVYTGAGWEAITSA